MEQPVTTLETPLERAPPPRDAMPPPERCPTCGADVPEGFRFCGQCGRALAATLAPAPGVLLTIVFTDLVGFSAFSSWAEAEELRTLIRAYHSLVREQMSRRSGFEVKQTGDGFMIAFASPARLPAGQQSTRRQTPPTVFCELLSKRSRCDW